MSTLPMSSYISGLKPNTKLEKIAQQLVEKKGFHILNLHAGKGGYGEVIIVKDQNQKEYAIKVLSLFDGIDQVCSKKLENAKNEAKILKRCNHPQIVKYEDEYQIGNNYFIVMEKCEQSLQEWVEIQKKQKNKVDKKVFISFAIQILKGVEYLHSINFLLRDISLKNILIDKKNNIKLCDFGLAKKFNPQIASEAFLTSQVKGTFLYLPPEVLEMSIDSDTQSEVYQNIQGDVWAVGVCLYLLAGASFQHILQFTQGFENYQYQDYLGVDINKTILLALSRNSEQRPSISQLIESFKQIQISSGIATKSKSDQLTSQTFNKAKSFYEQGDSTKCLDTLFSLIEIDSENKEYYDWIAKVNYENKSIEDTIYWKNKSLLLDSKNCETWSDLGSIYFEQNRKDEAKVYFGKALELNPRCQSAIKGIENISRIQNSSIIKINNEINSKDVDVLLSLAEEYLGKQMIENSIKCYQKVLAINPKEIPAIMGLASIYQSHKKMYDVAITYYKKALEIYPNYTPQLHPSKINS